MAGRSIRLYGGIKRRMSRISDSRIAELKYDEAVVNSRAKREGVPAKPTIGRCSCGNRNCGGYVWNQTPEYRTNVALRIGEGWK